MKKFLGMLAIAVALVACNDDAAAKKATEDSIAAAKTADSLAAAKTADSMAMAPAQMDTTMKMDSMKKDSMK
ncbi:MAG: hypothetical protein EOO05_02105 [Chitinophagaceae bacterium]|nr:MAG: hypothetical protein EOO05_02105 [Chitinophagaceae bacterium]